MSNCDLRLEIFVSDFERSAGFYERALGFVRENESPGYVSMRRGSARIGICLASELPHAHPLKQRSGERAGVGVEIVLEEDDVDAAYARVRSAKHPIQSLLSKRPWGLRDFRIIDPDGYYLRITSVD